MESADIVQFMCFIKQNYEDLNISSCTDITPQTAYDTNKDSESQHISLPLDVNSYSFMLFNI